ncbi:hypothetical protein [Clostridium polynesiense]|uniref:hypothetical protein n=1 Tax=Clostridium polynesiense TaxID=1325933 RepID=UPI00058B987E|nr:hypothetical protein [Clostridium polynesiense]
MNIYKAYDKQRKNYKRFNFLMIFLFIFLPAALYITGKTDMFFLSYLVFIEVLILTALILSKDNDTLEFDLKGDKISLKSGFFKKSYYIYCDKVAAVHCEKSYEELQIIILTTQISRNKSLKPITENFMKKFPQVAEEYMRLKKINPEFEYFYYIIKKGGFLKYDLLDMLFKNCVKAVFTENSINNIKMIRY